MSDAHVTGGAAAGGSAPATGQPYADSAPLIELSQEPIQLSNHDPDNPPGRRFLRSRRARWALAVALAVGLAGVGSLGAAGWRVAQQKDADLATPDTIGTLVRDDRERARSTADYLRSGFAAQIDLDRSFGAVYVDRDDESRPVLVFGGATLLWQPERDLDTLFTLTAGDTGEVTDIREVPAGPLGGVMKCGTTSGEGGDLPVCGWADHGSVVMAMFPGRTVTDAGNLLRAVREKIQTRS
ncbi:hypothetical protein AWW66_30110 [Micromonospora rosaria]|uniref:Uncharacterized protein n=1 Tax=Micromonospora rosaria TaxID=47874 RepID=A0A136PIY2_9ACTN|nr:hypothetical protein [Micromonospora rosaria]KXK58376.1 hypothetical protein AWW66_30110 [Micromonospora rosaria]